MATLLTSNGSDDTAAIQAAFDAGGNVIMGSGTFFVNAVVVNKSTYGTDLDLNVCGKNARIVALSDRTPIVFNNCDNIVINDLIVDGGTSINFSVDIAAIRLFGCRNVTMSNVRTHGFYIGITMGGSSSNPDTTDPVPNEDSSKPSTGFYFDRVVSEDAENDGWYQGWLNDAHFHHCDLIDNGANGVESNAQQTTYTHCNFHRNRVNGYSGKSSLTSTALNDCNADETVAAGFAFDNSGGATRGIRLRRCKAKYNRQSGLALDTISATNVMDDIRAEHCDFQSNSQEATQNWGNIRLNLVTATKAITNVELAYCLLDGRAPVAAQATENLIEASQQMADQLLGWHTDGLTLRSMRYINATTNTPTLAASVTNVTTIA